MKTAGSLNFTHFDFVNLKKDILGFLSTFLLFGVFSIKLVQ